MASLVGFCKAEVTQVGQRQVAIAVCYVADSLQLTRGQDASSWSRLGHGKHACWKD